MRLRLPFLPRGIRGRFLVVHLLLIAVPVSGVFFARFYEREMLAQLERDMVNQGRVVAAFVRSDPAGPQLAERESLLRAIAGDTRTRIRLLDPNGLLVADSHRAGPPEGAEPELPSILPSSASVRSASTRAVPAAELAERPEIRRALAGHYGAATRLYRNGDRLFLFSALPVRDRAGAILGAVYLTRSTNPVRAAMYRIRASLLVVFAITLVTTLVISLFLSATISQPLASLTKAAAAIAAGDRQRVLELGRDDEIGRLAAAFARMRDRLDARANDVAALAANVSHEFKSPLTSLRGAAELLLDGAAEDPVARDRFLRNILADSRRLDRLLTRLLELSRIEADAASDERLDWGTLVRETCESRRDAPLDLDPSAAVAVLGRRQALSSAVGNLVDNALQHAATGTRVTVRIALENGAIRTKVHNHGAPISPANLPRIWDRFFTTRAGEGGSGLGLPIVLAAARAHGGRVEVESSAGRGTTFTLVLPVA